jgi:thioesterase domain-containing protein
METPYKHSGPSADEARARLIAGNERFLRGEARCAALTRETLADLAKGQRPYATILGCSDSRVPPEWVFDAGLGELFVVRVAGNAVSQEIAGSLQYAGVHLQTPLFLVHALGGGVDYMVDLAPFINPDIPIYGLQATGFAPGEEPLKTIEEMAELYVEGIRQVQPQGPYQLAGWSSGGTIAYEMARRLMEMGEQVGFLGLLDTNYSEPGTMNSEGGGAKDFDANAELIQVLSMILAKEDLDEVIQMAQIYDFETLIERGSHIMEKIAREYPSVDTLDVAALRRILRIRHATANALLNYSLVRLSMPVWLFEAKGTVRPSGPAWRRLLGDDLQVVPVQGTHHTMTGLENLKSLGAAITGVLAKNSVQIISFPASHSLARSAAEV